MVWYYESEQLAWFMAGERHPQPKPRKGESEGQRSSMGHANTQNSSPPFD
jgi:hypothetical protein